jgi:hypothetical protein
MHVEPALDGSHGYFAVSRDSWISEGLSFSGRLLWDIRWASRLGRAQRLAADGRHGGKEVSTYLKDNLPGLIESVDSNGIDDLVKWTRNTHGGYYKRWRGGGLQRWTQYATGPTPEPGSEMTLEERLSQDVSIGLAR